jgi:sortase A
MDGGRTDRIVRWIERGLVAVGASCLLWVGATSLSAIVYQVEQSASQERVGQLLRRPGADLVANVVKTTLEAGSPIGRLEIPRIGLTAVVAEGDDEKTLKLAVGHLPDTPLPWQEGNSALAGHRDSFFRPLRHIQVGDDIHLTTVRGTLRYRVTRHTVVDPAELWVLNPSPTVALTLITCYPFDYVGPAPRRFIVHAERLLNTSDNAPTTATEGGTP